MHQVVAARPVRAEPDVHPPRSPAGRSTELKLVRHSLAKGEWVMATGRHRRRSLGPGEENPEREPLRGRRVNTQHCNLTRPVATCTERRQKRSPSGYSRIRLTETDNQGSGKDDSDGDPRCPRPTRTDSPTEPPHV